MTPGTPRFVVLDALRGLCACLVCLFHFRVNSPITEWPVVQGGWLFVDFFFVLSGFVVAANYRDRLASGMRLGQFALLRFGRLYPLHLFMLALFVVTELVGAAATGLMRRPAFEGAYDPAAIPLNLLLLNAVHLDDKLTWNGPSWSIAAEFWTYLLFAGLALWAGRRLERWLPLVIAACVAALWFATPHGINVTWDFGLIRAVYGFAIGVLAFALWRRLAADGGGAGGVGWSVAEVALVIAIAVFVAFVEGPATLAGPPLFGIAVLLFAREAGVVSRLLDRPPLLWIGALSYSIYMVHIFVQARFDDMLKFVGRASGTELLGERLSGGRLLDVAGATPLQGTLLIPVMFGMVIAVAWVTYTYIERPAQRWSRRVAAGIGVPEGRLGASR